ncbi:uncharacterized protein LOC116306019 [Actinia tenebrosa]|uniref:Uncharacterized protein LOC116306019 n=1 Tax=Actinia tenebrosa TaxID=6105 RepID=A0A6P8J194_ACTTE|nr:uncharacterized protein LOC116306019 [Actinia tenebrosa]
MYLLLLLVVAMLEICLQGVCGNRLSYGQLHSSCEKKQEDLRTQICPKDNNDRKYVRIRTYNNKYLWAYGTENGDNSYVRTRCCGGKDAVGRTDVMIPGLRTTFRVHCGKIGNQDTVRFEVLTDKRTGVIRPSGYYFYADTRWKKLFSKQNPSSSDSDANFILTRWRGPVIAIKSARNRYWWTFAEDGHGSILIKSHTVQRYPRFPPLYDAFTLEMVPRECIEVPKSERILAAVSATNVEECEKRPDRCFFSDGWDTTRHVVLPGTCFYKKDSMCYQPNVASRRSCPQQGSKDCEAANCCYDYQRNTCYQGN